MADEKQKIVEWAAEPVRPRMAFEGEEEVYDTAVAPECADRGEVALHITRDGADYPIASTYYTPAQAYILAERIRTAAWIAEQLGAPDA